MNAYNSLCTSRSSFFSRRQHKVEARAGRPAIACPVVDSALDLHACARPYIAYAIEFLDLRVIQCRSLSIPESLVSETITQITDVRGLGTFQHAAPGRVVAVRPRVSSSARSGLRCRKRTRARPCGIYEYVRNILGEVFFCARPLARPMWCACTPMYVYNTHTFTWTQAVYT